jgi:hypothetical protein
MSDGYWLNEAAAKQAENDLLKTDAELLRAALRWFVAAYDKEHPLRTADQHPASCDCLRCARDSAQYLTRTDG